MQNRLDYAFHPVLGYDLLRIPCVFPPVTRIHTKIGKNDRLLMLHARDACCSGTPGMIMCSVFMELGSLRFRSSWPSSIIMYMHHSLTVQYPIQRCGTAEGTNQHRTTRTSSAFDHTVFSNLISESKLDETLTIRSWSIRLDCDAAQVGHRGHVHTIKKLSIILKKIQMDGQKFPPSTPLQVKSHPSLAQNRISRFTQIIEQQPEPPLTSVTSLIFYPMSFWTPRFPPHDHIYRNKLSQIMRVDGQVM
jgi:hypothetical protein